VARRATFIQAARAEHPNLLVLDAGNTFWSSVDLGMRTQGKVIAEAMSLIGYDAMALGETDLQLGEDILRRRMAECRFPVLSANVVVASTGSLFTRPYALLEAGGRKVAVIGLTGSGSVPDTSEAGEPAGAALPIPAPSPLSGPSPLTPTPTSGTHVIQSLAILDPVPALQRALQELESQANIVIVLSNLGLEANQQLAETVEGVDLIISAGPGQIVPQPYQSPNTGTLVCQDSVFPQAHPGQTVANVKMHFDGDGVVSAFSGGDAALGPEYEGNETVQKLLDDYQLK
jgi:5'-nucleotidase/UDP-sugar diphosphatase